MIFNDSTGTILDQKATYLLLVGNRKISNMCYGSGLDREVIKRSGECNVTMNFGGDDIVIRHNIIKGLYEEFEFERNNYLGRLADLNRARNDAIFADKKAGFDSKINTVKKILNNYRDFKLYRNDIKCAIVDSYELSDHFERIVLVDSPSWKNKNYAVEFKKCVKSTLEAIYDDAGDRDFSIATYQLSATKNGFGKNESYDMIKQLWLEVSEERCNHYNYNNNATLTIYNMSERQNSYEPFVSDGEDDDLDNEFKFSFSTLAEQRLKLTDKDETVKYGQRIGRILRNNLHEKYKLSNGDIKYTSMLNDFMELTGISNFGRNTISSHYSGSKTPLTEEVYYVYAILNEMSEKAFIELGNAIGLEDYVIKKKYYDVSRVIEARRGAKISEQDNNSENKDIEK